MRTGQAVRHSTEVENKQIVCPIWGRMYNNLSLLQGVHILVCCLASAYLRQATTVRIT